MSANRHCDELAQGLRLTLNRLEAVLESRPVRDADEVIAQAYRLLADHDLRKIAERRAS